MKIIFEVEIQTYDVTDEDEREILTQIRDAMEAVVRLSELSVGEVFTKSEIKED